MVKKLFSTIFVFIFFLFISIKIDNAVQAQTNPGSSAQLWRCLQASTVTEQTPRPPSAVDLNVSGKGFPSYQDTFIVLCIPPKKNSGQTSYKCSTGNPESDKFIS